MSLVFLGGARRLKLFPCNTSDSLHPSGRYRVDSGTAGAGLEDGCGDAWPTRMLVEGLQASIDTPEPRWERCCSLWACRLPCRTRPFTSTIVTAITPAPAIPITVTLTVTIALV